MPIPISRRQARLVARACRALAYIERQDAPRQYFPETTAAMLQRADELMRLAEVFEAHARSGPAGS